VYIVKAISYNVGFYLYLTEKQTVIHVMILKITDLWRKVHLRRLNFDFENDFDS